jgi:hypothetical protein
LLLDLEACQPGLELAYRLLLMVFHHGLWRLSILLASAVL